MKSMLSAFHIKAHWILLVIVINPHAFALESPKHPTDEVAYYIDHYGEVLPETDPQVARAHKVFQQIRAVADKSTKRFPTLTVVNNRKSPWAIALPNGHIVLSMEAVIICHLNASNTEAETRLAFVLGHELAHLAHDDFWHREIYQFLITQPNNQKHLQVPSDREIRERELKADDKGFIYAALAGFPVESLLEADKNKLDFFALWMQQANTRAFARRNSAETRALLLRKRLSDLKDQIALFEFGIRLAHFDYCDDAVYFLQEFQKVFPGREVLSNLGFCYLQLARQAMDPARANFYWMPLVLDGETRVGAYTRRTGSFLKSLRQAAKGGEAEGFLQQALRYLNHAVEADAGYLPARLNLITALLYLGRPHAARDILAETKMLDPENPTIHGLEALALYEQSDADQDLWPKAVAKLNQMVAKHTVPPHIIFNLARLLDSRPRPSEARAYWNRLAVKAERLPNPIRDIVCGKKSEVNPMACNRIAQNSIQPLPWKWPISTTDGKPLSATNRQTLKNWKRVDVNWFAEGLQGRIYQRPDGKAEILELDQFVQLQVLKGKSIGNIRALSTYCDNPIRKRILVHGTVWSCGNWAVLAENDTIRQAWWIAK